MKKIAVIGLQCCHCKKEFTVPVSWGINYIKKAGRGKYCSKSCYYESRKGKRVSPNSEFTTENTGWDSHSRFVNGKWAYQQFKKSQCEECDSVDNLHVHHVDRDRTNNEISNLKTLCSKCHGKAHRGYRVAWNKGLRIAV